MMLASRRLCSQCDNESMQGFMIKGSVTGEEAYDGMIKGKLQREREMGDGERRTRQGGLVLKCVALRFDKRL